MQTNIQDDEQNCSPASQGESSLDKIILAASRYGGTLILEAIGQNAVNETDYSAYADDHTFDTEVPTKPGVYVWEGRIRYHHDDITWAGSFRPATADDLNSLEIN